MRAVPFFIVGCGRSGTTLLQALLDSHPDLAIPPESYVYVRFGRIYRTWGDLALRRNRERLIGALLRDAYIREWCLDAATRDVEQRVSRNSFGGVIDALFSCYAAMHGAKRWGDKTPSHIRHLPEIRRDFSRARLIHLVRDGRDVAEAMRRMMFYPVSAVGLGRTWRNEVMRWQAFCAAAGSAGTLVVKYEDLVTSTREVLRTVLAFLGEPYVDTVATYADSSLSRKLHAEDPWQSSLRQGIGAGKVGVYRRRFTAREIEILESIQAEALAAYGYSADNQAPRAPTAGDRAAGFVTDRLVRWRRKLFHPRVYRRELQSWLRLACRLPLGGLRKGTNEA